MFARLLSVRLSIGGSNSKSSHRLMYDIDEVCAPINSCDRGGGNNISAIL